MDFDFLSSNLQIAYPFTENVNVGRYGADAEVAGLVAACDIRTTDQREELLSVSAIYIESSTFPGTIDEADITLIWTTSGDTISLSKTGGTAQFALSTYGSWIVAEWYAPSELSGGEDIAIKMVFPSSVVETDSGVTYIQIDKDTEDLILQSSSVIQGPDKLRRVYWKRGDTLELVADRGEEFIVKAGFNMSISELGSVFDGGRKLTQVGIDAVPGAGAGKYLLCPGSAYLFTMNGVSPNTQSDLLLNPLECYWSSRELDGEIVPVISDNGITGSASLKPAEVSIGNGCTACCSCDDYIAAYNYLKALWDSGKLVSDRIYAARDLYASLVAQFDSFACNSPLSTSIRSTEDVPPIISLGITICNTSDIPWSGILLTVDASLVDPDSGDPADATLDFRGGFTYSGTSGFNIVPRDGGGSEVEDTIEVCIPAGQSLIWRGNFQVGGSDYGGKEFVAEIEISGGGIATPYSLVSTYVVPDPEEEEEE